MQSKAKTVDEYIKSLPEERAEIVSTLRKLILDNIQDGFVETMNWGMIVYEIPLERYPETYNGQPLGYLALASQKNYLSLYLDVTYGGKESERWFREEYKKAGKKLDMGKVCLRFKKLDDLPLELIAKVIGMASVEEWIEHYEKSRSIENNNLASN